MPGGLFVEPLYGGSHRAFLDGLRAQTSQFTYPRIRGTKFNSWFEQLNYLSAAVADGVAFNSEFHRSDFLAALRTLDSQPNNWLLSGAIDGIEARAVPGRA